MNTEVTIGPARLLWADLVSPSELSGKYGVKIGVPKSSKSMEAIKRAIGAAKAAIGNPKAKQPVSDGDRSEYEQDHGCWVMRASTKFVPPCFDSDSSRIAPEQLYSGCQVIVSVAVFAYDNKFGKGVGLMLRWIQFAGDGERLGGSEDIQPPPPIDGATRIGSGGGPDGYEANNSYQPDYDHEANSYQPDDDHWGRDDEEAF